MRTSELGDLRRQGGITGLGGLGGLGGLPGLEDLRVGEILADQGAPGGMAGQRDLGGPKGWERPGVTRLSRRWRSGAGPQGLAGTTAYAGQRKLT